MHQHTEHKITPPKRYCSGCGHIIISHTVKDIFIPGVGGMKICEACYDKVEGLLPDLKDNVEKEKLRVKSYPSSYYDWGPKPYIPPPKQKMVLRYRPKDEEDPFDPEDYAEPTPEGG